MTPGLTAEASLYRSTRSYSTERYGTTGAKVTVVPSAISPALFCSGACLACTLSLMDPIPLASEAILCGGCYICSKAWGLQ
jgi:hypothetical protein